jgi:hypothetical protein
VPPASAGARFKKRISILAIFAVLQTDHVVQVGDKTRLDASSSFVSPAAEITKLEIKPSGDDDFIECAPGALYLDWVYQEAGSVEAQVRVTIGEGEDATTATGQADFTVLSEDDDRLFSSDADLKGVVPSIYNLLPDGRASFKYAHRAAQEIILDRINRRVKANDWISAAAVAKVFQVQQWSKYLTLSLIYGAAQIAKDDLFLQEHARFANSATKYENDAYIELKLDGSTETNAEVSFGSVGVRRT